MGESQRDCVRPSPLVPYMPGRPTSSPPIPPGHQSQRAPRRNKLNEGDRCAVAPHIHCHPPTTGPPHGPPVLFIDLVHVRVVRKVEVAANVKRPWPRRKIEDRIVVFTPLLTPTSLPWKGWRFCSEKGVPRKCRYLRSRGLSLFRGMSSIGSMQPFATQSALPPAAGEGPSPCTGRRPPAG